MARAGEFGGKGLRFTGEEALAGCLPKDRKDEMLRLAGMMGLVVAAGLGGEEREDPLGGKREESILLDHWGGAYDYTRTGISLVAWYWKHRPATGSKWILGTAGDEEFLWHKILNGLS